MNWGTVILVTVVVLFFVVPKLRQVPKKEAVEMLRQGAAFIDVRTRGEFAQHSIPGSLNLPLQELAKAIRQEKIDPTDPILVFCHSGMRSSAAMRQLRSLGYTRVRNIGSFARAHSIWNLSNSQSE
ncbi:MAG TPA: rhodanese-like domain-containing protein [Oceanipulchritudo sp.]|nr:rhodanese-like domain-containing protein [Oceanipulchritudo sp.]